MSRCTPMALVRILGAVLVVLLLPSCVGWRLSNVGSDKHLNITAPSVVGDSQNERVLALANSIQAPTREFVLTKVEKLQAQPVCGMGAMLTMLTFGIVPGSLPAPYFASVEGLVHGKAVKRDYRLTLWRNYSLVHGFIPKSHDERVLARALVGAIAENRSDSRRIQSSRRDQSQ